MENWMPGVPENPVDDQLYAVMSKPESGYAVGCVIRGADCNWKSRGIIAHYPLSLSMGQATMLRLKRKGEFDA